MPRERYAELGERYRQHYFARQHELGLFPGTLPMLQALRDRAGTGWRSPPARRGAASTPRSTRRSCAALFDGSRTADETASKPDPRMLLELMHEFGVAPERTLMIGDTTHDLQMAANAGAAGVAVSYGAHEPRRVRGVRAARAWRIRPPSCTTGCSGMPESRQ